MKSIPFVQRLRLAWQMLRSSKAAHTLEMLHAQSSRRLPDGWQPSGDYVMVNGYVLLPVEMQRHIAQHGIRMDWDYFDGGKVWKFHTDKEVSFTHFTQDRLTALHVVKKLEK